MHHGGLAKRLEQSRCGAAEHASKYAPQKPGPTSFACSYYIGDGQVLPSMKGDTVIGINRIILITSSSQIENLVTDGRNYTGLGTLKTTTNVLMITEA